MYDAIIVGAGPGGTTSGARLAEAGANVLVLDRATFPRDKICGDAISGKSVEMLRELGLLDRVVQSESIGSWGVTFGGPSGEDVAIPFTKALDKPVAPGFVSRREVFDNVLYEHAVGAGAEVRTGVEVTKLLRHHDGAVRGVVARDSSGRVSELEAPITIGADGAYSIVARDLGITQLSEKHYCAGLRSYYRGVTGFSDGNFIEIHFVDESLPGYFWIFPLPNGMANVGVGMLSSAVKKKGVRLRRLLEQLVEHPRFADRFKNAERVGPVKGWGLPLGSKPRTMAGDGWMLAGDAASLIDPFTGEGIGNAMVTGWFAAKQSLDALDAADFSAGFLRSYEERVLERLRGELRLSHAMQRLGNQRWLLNLVIRKASRSREIADAISCMFDDLGERRRLVSPVFYLKVLAA